MGKARLLSSKIGGRLSNSDDNDNTTLGKRLHSDRWKILHIYYLNCMNSVPSHGTWSWQLSYLEQPRASLTTHTHVLGLAECGNALLTITVLLCGFFQKKSEFGFCQWTSRYSIVLLKGCLLPIPEISVASQKYDGTSIGHDSAFWETSWQGLVAIARILLEGVFARLTRASASYCSHSWPVTFFMLSNPDRLHSILFILILAIF